jgi:molybdopterin synthase catalytic subunit
MSDGVVLATVRAHPLSLDECSAAVGGPAAGAVVTFSGIVRDHDAGRSVVALDYEAHPTAEAALRTVAEEIARRHPAVRIAIAHRTGALTVGDLALACAVSSAHRAEAFVACSALIDEVKARVPIWKEQRFDDGTSEWVGSLG